MTEKNSSCWLTGVPSDKSLWFNREGDNICLPMLFLCKCLTMDMSLGYRYTYRIGFVTESGDWNIDVAGGLIKVVGYRFIEDNECGDDYLLKDIERYEDSFVNRAINAIQSNQKPKNKTPRKKNVKLNKD